MIESCEKLQNSLYFGSFDKFKENEYIKLQTINSNKLIILKNVSPCGNLKTSETVLKLIKSIGQYNISSNIMVNVLIPHSQKFKNIQMNLKFLHILDQPYNTDLNYANIFLNKQIDVQSCIKRQLKRFNVVVQKNQVLLIKIYGWNYVFKIKSLIYQNAQMENLPVRFSKSFQINIDFLSVLGQKLFLKQQLQNVFPSVNLFIKEIQIDNVKKINSLQEILQLQTINEVWKTRQQYLLFQQNDYLFETLFKFNIKNLVILDINVLLNNDFSSFKDFFECLQEQISKLSVVILIENSHLLQDITQDYIIVYDQFVAKQKKNLILFKIYNEKKLNLNIQVISNQNIKSFYLEFLKIYRKIQFQEFNEVFVSKALDNISFKNFTDFIKQIEILL